MNYNWVVKTIIIYILSLVHFSPSFTQECMDPEVLEGFEEEDRAEYFDKEVIPCLSKLSFGETKLLMYKKAIVEYKKYNLEEARRIRNLIINEINRKIQNIKKAELVNFDKEEEELVLLQKKISVNEQKLKMLAKDSSDYANLKFDIDEDIQMLNEKMEELEIKRTALKRTVAYLGRIDKIKMEIQKLQL